MFADRGGVAPWSADPELSMVDTMFRDGRHERALHRLATVLGDARSARTRASWERWLRDTFERSSLCDHLIGELARLRRLASSVELGGNMALVDALSGGVETRLSAAIARLPFVRSWGQRPASFARRLQRIGRGTVVVIGCGNLARMCSVPAVRGGQLSILGVDSDLGTIESARRGIAVPTVAFQYTSLQQFLLFGTGRSARACLIPYAFDHHDDMLMVKLLRRALLLMAPGGVVLGSNLTAAGDPGAFVEAVTTARLHCRSQRELRGLVDQLPVPLRGEVDVHLDDTGASWTIRILRR